MARIKFLRHRIDIYPISIAVIVSAGQLSLYLMHSQSLIWFVALMVALRWSHLIEHNHVHMSMFHSARLSEFFGWVLGCSTGLPLEMYRVHHVETHHQYENGPEDWTSPFEYGDGTSSLPRPMTFSRYVLSFPLRGWTNSLRILWRRKGTEQYNAWLRSLAILVLFGGALTLGDSRSFLIWYVTPWIAYSFGAGAANWRHHDSEDPLSMSPGTNDNFGLFSRRLGFNIGYHSAHHLYPDTHWSELPQRVTA